MFFSMKGRSKKIVALLLSASMMCSMDAATVFAANEPEEPEYNLVVEDEGFASEEAYTEEAVAAVVGNDASDGVVLDGDDSEAIKDYDETKILNAEDLEESEGFVGIPEDGTPEISDTESASDNEIIDSVSEDNLALEIEDEADIDNLTTVSGNPIEISTNQVKREKTGFVIDQSKIKANIDKRYRLKVSWRKPVGAKGKITYHIYKMKEDGTFPETETFTTTKASFRDDTIGTSDAPMVYMIIPEGGYMNKFNVIKGDAAYAIASPLAVNASRTSNVSNNDISIAVQFTDLKVSENMVLYELERATKNKKGMFNTISSGDLTECELGDDAKKVIKPLSGTASIVSITDKQYEEHEYGKTYFYKVKATVTIDGVKYSSESKSIKTIVYERAPRSVSAISLTGTKAFIYWEDMTGNGGAIVNDSLLEDTDAYQLYYSINGGKLRKYKRLLAKDVPVLDTVSTNVVMNPYDRSAVSANILSSGHYTAYYTASELKANANYQFYVAPVRAKKIGAMAGSNIIQTDLQDLRSLSVDQLSDKALTVTWESVEGATKYNLYYKKCSSIDEANKTVKAWQDLKGAPSDYTKMVKVNKSKNKTVTYLHKKLTTGDYYVYKAIPVRGKSARNGSPFEPGERDNVSKNNINTGTGMVRLATPVVTVKEQDGKVTFTWKKIKGAAGYAIYSAKVDKANEQLRKIGHIEDPKAKQITGVSVKSGDLGFSSFNLGEGVSIQVVAYSASSPLYYSTDKYSDTDTMSSRRSKVYTGYNRPKTPESVKAVFSNIGTGATLKMKSGYSAKDLDKTVMGYKVMYSYTGKNFTTLSANINSGKIGTEYIDFTDNRPLTDGKSITYRVYAVAVPYTGDAADNYNEDKQVLSKKYVEVKYCQPSKISKDTVTVKAGQTVKVNINYKPSATTMKQMEAWRVGDTSDTTTLELNSKSYITTSNGVMKAMADTYDDAGTAGFSDTIKITGIKAGKAYVKAKTKNGLEVTFRVDVTNGASNKKSGTSNGKTIVLDPGHGGNDGGASNGSLKESEINLKISQYTQEYLEEDGFDVYLTRTSDKYVGLADRVVYAKQKGASVIVSQHINSGGKKGAECYYSVDGTGKELAEKMCSKVHSEVGLDNRGAKTRKGDNGDYYAIIRYARSDAKEYGGKKITGIIMENAFIDGDADVLKDEAKLKAIAKANAAAIKECYK